MRKRFHFSEAVFMRVKLDGILTSQWFIGFLYRFIRAYAWTFRLRIVNEQGWLHYIENGGSVLLCAWHQQFFSAIRHFRNYRRFNPGIMISRSKDGEIIAGIARRTGWHPVRGSSSRGGQAAMHSVIDGLKNTQLAGHVIDGPRGPAGQVKAGVIRMAHATDAVIVPFYVSAEKAWYFNSWDRFMLPKPFSRVVLRFGDMIRLAPIANENDFEEQRRQLEQTMRPALVGF
jgi:lysophospholipid acyltransferase (LPLAT)-like uncharacterized protein